MIKTPPYLQPGSTIGMVCPAGYMAADKVQDCIDQLNEWGFHVKTGMTVGSSSDNYFSGTDDERLADLQQMLDDKRIDAILFGRGGYGMTRIIDRIDFKSFREYPKWLIGFSDITLLHLHIYTTCNIATIHGPMAGAFIDKEKDDEYLKSLRNVMAGHKIKYSLAGRHPLNRTGEAVGELIGGNLAMIAHSMGTPSEIKTKGKILFIEDVGEYLYNIDRMFRQLKRAGKLEKLAGLIVGGFTDNKDTQRPFGKTVHEIISEVVGEYDFPVCFDFPIGHGPHNYAVKMGAGYKLKVAKTKVVLGE